MDDWWSEGDDECRGGGLGYWLAISFIQRELVQREHADPDMQKLKLIDLWLQLHAFASWHWLSRALQRVGHTQLATLIATYEQPPTGKQMAPCVAFLLSPSIALCVCCR